jgi:hypothetical protein
MVMDYKQQIYEHVTKYNHAYSLEEVGFIYAFIADCMSIKEAYKFFSYMDQLNSDMAYANGM